jgi:hypothetical protein
MNQNEDFFDSDYENEQNEEQESYQKNNQIFEEQGVWSQTIGGINNKCIIFITIVCHYSNAIHRVDVCVE